MSPSPTNAGRSGDSASTGQSGGPTPAQLQACQTAQALAGPKNPGGNTLPPPNLPPTVTVAPTKGGYTPTTSMPDTGAGGTGAIPSRIQSLLSLVQPGVLGNSSTDPLFRLTYGSALGLGLSGDQRDPVPLYNPFSGAKS